MAEKKKLSFATVEDAIENFKDENLWISDCFEICEPKAREDGSKGDKYMRVKKAILLEEGQILQIKSRKKSLEDLLAKGFISQEEFDKRLKAAPWVTHVVSAPPRKKK
jgi:hypothetical protein